MKHNTTLQTAITTMLTETYDRAKDVQQFEDSKLGVKGLVESGITTIPRFFIHPPDTLSDLKPLNSTTRLHQDIVPLIDLSGVDSDLLRPTIVEYVASASRHLGFFQIVNHGIGVEVLDRVLGALKGFHELPPEVKTQIYGRDTSRGVSFFSNIDLFHSKAASWRDTLLIKLDPTLPKLAEIPEICRNEVVEWNEHVKKLGELLMGLLCEGLGVDTERLKKMKFLEQKSLVAQYYPYCPQPNLTVGINSHTDPGALTVLLQDHSGGLQVKYGGEWVDLKPVPGALVINIGDTLRIMSNDEYKSSDHRVLANSSRKSRISAAVIFYPRDWYSLYGPFPELTSPEKPSRFRQFTYTEYMKRFYSNEIDGKSLVNYFMLSDNE